MQEIRHLVFGTREMHELALGFLAERGNRPHPVSSSWALRTGPEGIRLVLTYTELRTAGSRALTLDPSELLSAAILFCKRRGVPLPLRGQKSLTIMEGGALALVVAMRLGE